MKNTIDMTTGAVSRNIVYFALPVFIGSMFQQLYNTADSLFVGNFIGSRALAAVSSAGYLIFLLVGFFDGVFMGAGVVIGHFIGAKDASQTQKAVHTTVSLGLITGALLTVLGIFLAPVILRLIGTPDEVMAESLVYFRIYFSGSLVLVLYNTFTGILRAAGDSKSPLYFLIVSSVANIVLDFFFVGVLRLGVGSVALATVISETLSVVLCLKKLLSVEGSHRLYLKKISIDINLFKKIIRIGVPSGAQNSIIGFANIVVQSHINSFGALAMAGQGAYSKIEGFAFLPITSFTAALTTFVSQNIGAKEFDRVKEGARFGTLWTCILAEAIGLVTFTFAPLLVSAFDSNAEAVAYGVSRARVCSFFYCLLAYSHALSAILRGQGKSIVPMVVMLICWCIIRVTILTIGFMFAHSILIVNCVYPITWALSTILFTIYYFSADKKRL